jgi:cytochrome c
MSDRSPPRVNKMSRSARINVGMAILIALAAVLLMRVHTAGGAKLGNASEGHRLAEAWCNPCHAIEPHVAGLVDQAPSFEAIANRHGTTAISLKVFLKTNHANMPNLIMTPDQADALASYILSLNTR